jgi:hypothetical protein
LRWLWLDIWWEVCGGRTVALLGVKGKMDERVRHFNQPGALNGQVPGMLQNTH